MSGRARGLNRGAFRSGDRFDFRERRARLGEPSELKQFVLQPRQRVIVAQRERTLFLTDPGIRRVIGGAVGGRGIVPETELQKHMRRHVERVARASRDLRVGARRIQRQGCVLRIVVGVQQVMQCAGVARVAGEYAGQQRGHLLLQLAARKPLVVRVAEADQASRHRPQPRQRVERDNVGIVREIRRGGFHRFEIAAMSCLRVTLSE